jgi:hypothetical protein
MNIARFTAGHAVDAGIPPNPTPSEFIHAGEMDAIAGSPR